MLIHQCMQIFLLVSPAIVFFMNIPTFLVKTGPENQQISIQADNVISEYMFWGMPRISVLSLPMSAVTIKTNAVGNNKNMSVLNIRKNLTRIERNALHLGKNIHVFHLYIDAAPETLTIEDEFCVSPKNNVLLYLTKEFL